MSRNLWNRVRNSSYVTAYASLLKLSLMIGFIVPTIVLAGFGFIFFREAGFIGGLLFPLVLFGAYKYQQERRADDLANAGDVKTWKNQGPATEFWIKSHSEEVKERE